MKIGLCKPSKTIPTERGWIFEKKLDGARGEGIGGDLFNREEDHTGSKITSKFPEIEVPEKLVLDGELVSPAGIGKVVGRQNLSNKFKIRTEAKSCPAKYSAFDLLAVGNEDLRKEPLWKRKTRLFYELSQRDCKGVFYVPNYYDGQKLWEKAVENDWEGIVAKKINSPYPKGRSQNWLKIKNFKEDLFPIEKYEITEDKGFVVHIPVDDGTQRIVVNDKKEQEKIKNADNGLMAEIKYLEKNEEGRLRHIAFKRAVRR